MNNPISAHGMICIWCFRFLPVENFKHKHKEDKYFKTCNNCRDRPVTIKKTDEWKNERTEYNCGCGTVLYLLKKKANSLQQMAIHERTKKHCLYEKHKDNYDEYIKNKKIAHKQKQKENLKKWRDKQKKMYYQNKCIN